MTAARPLNWGNLRNSVSVSAMSASPVLIFLRARLRTFGGEFAVGTGEGARNGAPEQVGRCRDKTVRSEFIGEIAQVLIDAVHGARQHYRRHRAVCLRHRQIAIEVAARAPVDPDGLARHVVFPLCGLPALKTEGKIRLILRSRRRRRLEG
jgi:hypothetical protein